MSALPTFLRTALAAVFLYFYVPALAEPRRASIEPVITSNGSLVLQVAEMEEESDLLGVREYAIMVSEDLLVWEEIARSTLLEELELVDLEGRGRPLRFYRIVGVDLDDSVRAFAERVSAALSDVRDYTSGIVLDGFTAEEYDEVLNRLATIREEIAALLDSGAAVPESLLRLFRERSGEIDRMLARQPLILEWEGKEFEVEISRAMDALNEQYARLEAPGLQDYDRLFGIDASDLEGLESLAEYVERRQVGIESSLPVFEAISPNGQFELTIRLVRKFLNRLSETVEDTDEDGAWEVDYGLYARLLNGLEQVARENADLADAIEREHPADLGLLRSNPVSNDVLGSCIQELDLQQARLKERLIENTHGKNLEKVFAREALAETRRLLESRRREAFGALEKIVLRPALEIELFPPFELELPERELTNVQLETARLELSSYRETARLAALAFFDEYELSPEFRDLGAAFFEKILNGYYRDSRRELGIYGKPFSIWERALGGGDLHFADARGDFVSVSPEVRGLMDLLPADVDGLMARSEIATAVEREELESYLSEQAYARLRSVKFDTEGLSSGRLSYYGMQVQLLGALISHYGDGLVAKGRVGFVELGRAVLFGDSLDSEIGQVEEMAEIALSELEALELRKTGGVHWRDLFAQKDILKGYLESIMKLDTKAQEDGPYFEQEFIMRLASDRWKRIWSEVAWLWEDESFGASQLLVRLEIDGESLEVSAGWLFRVVERTLKRIAVPGYYGRFTREQWARLSGLTEDELLGVDPYWYFGSYLPYAVSFEGETREYLLEQSPHRTEVYLGLVPRLLESLGQEVLADAGGLDETKVEAALLRGLEVSVPQGKTLEGIVKGAAREALDQFSGRHQSSDFSEWSAWERMVEDFNATRRELAREALPFVKGLTGNERELLARSQSFDLASYFLSVFEERRDGAAECAVVLGGENALLEFAEVESWLDSHFWYGKEHYMGRFRGMVEGDFAEAMRLDSSLVYSADGQLTADDLYRSFVDPRSLAVAVLKRIVAGGDEVGTVYRKSIVVDGVVNVEALRRFCLGLDALYEDIVLSARRSVSDSLVRIQAMANSPMTVAKVEALYAEILESRETLLALVANSVEGIPSADVVEIEEAVTEEYQRLFQVLKDYLRSHPLAVEGVNGLLELDAGAFRDRLVDVLESRFPGEELAAYHFASFYGISVGELREMDKLESFLSAQVVALPRNSEFVEVVSKFSDLGYLQFIDLLVRRFERDAYLEESGTLDLEKLIEVASEEETGIARAEVRVDEVFDEALAAIDSIAEPLSHASLNAMVSELVKQKEQVLAAMTDEVSALSVEGLKRVRERFAKRKAEFVTYIENRVVGKLIRIEAIDGSQFSLDMLALEEALVAVLQSALDESEDGELLESESHVWKDSKVEVYAFIARLAYAFGHFCLENGSFSVERFAEQLETEDTERLEALAVIAFEEEKPKLEAVFPERTQLVSLSEYAVLSEQLARSRPRFLRLSEREGSQGIWGIRSFGFGVRQRWYELMSLYEEQLREADLTLEKGGVTAQVPLQKLNELALAAIEEGKSAFLDQYAEGGETYLDYYNFYYLFGEMEESDLLQPSAFGIHSSELSGVRNPVVGWTDSEEPEKTDVNNAFARFVALPGIVEMDTDGLILGRLDSLELPRRSAEELMRGALNLRAIAPGSPIFRPGNEFIGTDGRISFEGDRYRSLSWRDQRFRVLALISLEYWELLVDEAGAYRLDVFDALIRMDLEDSLGETN